MRIQVTFQKGKKQYSLVCNSVNIYSKYPFFYFDNNCNYVRNAKVINVFPTDSECWIPEETKKVFAIQD
jgi:hypothetical protein